MVTAVADETATTATTRGTGGQAVVAALAAQGVETVFGIPGVHTLAIYDALRDGPLRHVLARHEQGAGFMADGYARASGRPGVALVITGPGATNAATPLGEAYADSSPVLVVASGNEQAVAGRMVGDLHELRDQLGLMRHLVAWGERATSVAEVPALVAEAFRHMGTGRPRPTYLEVPLDVLTGDGEFTASAGVCLPPAVPDPADIAGAVAAIADAERVVIFAGGGAVAAGANDGLIALAERLGAPVLTSQQGKGSIPEDHPLSLGSLWERGNAVDETLQGADLAIVVGAKLWAGDAERCPLPMPAKVVRIDIDAAETERHYAPVRAIVADARQAVDALVAALVDEAITKPGRSAAEVAEIRRRALADAWGAEQAPYLAALRRAIPRDGIIVNDMTMMSYLATVRYPAYEPRSFFSPTGYATLGFALPAAIGAKVARPETTVVAVCGDGGFQYTMEELAVAIQHNIGLPIVLFNDSTYTAVKTAQAREQGSRFFGVDLVNPDFVKLAAAYGIGGVRAESPEALERAVREAAGRDRPTIIDVPIRF